MNDRGRIVFVTSSAGIWGAERSLISIARGCFLQGVEVSLICSNPELERLWRSEINDYVIISPLNGRGMVLFSRLSILISALRQEPPTAFVSFQAQLVPYLQLTRLRWPIKRPRLILDLHDVFTSSGGRRKLRAVARMTDHVIAVSEFAARQVRDIVRTDVVWRPVRPVSTRSRSQNEKILLGMIGRIDRVKEIGFAIRAASLAAEVIGGFVLRGAPYEEDDEYLQEMLGLGASLLGPLFKYDGVVKPERLFDEIDILVFANRGEPSGRVIAEAQASGLAVIAPDSGGAAEFVIDGVTGVLYGAGSASELAEKIRSLSLNRGLISSIGDNARLFAAGHYEELSQSARYADVVTGRDSAVGASSREFRASRMRRRKGIDE